MKRVDLNADLGESFGAYTIGMDEEVIKLVSSVNIACGFHASDPVVMQKTVQLCKDSGTAVGAHPGFPDLSGFGRRQMKVSLAELKAMVTAINADVVQPEEVLTNNVYHYDGDERIFEQAEAYDARQASGLDEKKPSLLKNLKDLEEKPAPEPRSGKDEMSL